MRKGERKGLISSTYVYVTASVTFQKQHGASLNDGSQPPCSLKKTENSMSGHFFHIMQNEMNVTNRFTTNQRKLESTRDQKIIEKRSWVVTCGKTTSDLVTAHLSKVFARHAELTAV